MFEGLFQPMHLLVIFGIALLVFGPKKLPELGKGIGEGIRGFKSAMKADEEKPVSTATTIASDQGLTKEWIVSFGTEILFMLMLGLVVMGPKRLHSMLGHVARAKAELENAIRGTKSQLAAQLDPAPQESQTDRSHESVVNQWTIRGVPVSEQRTRRSSSPKSKRPALRNESQARSESFVISQPGREYSGSHQVLQGISAWPQWFMSHLVRHEIRQKGI
jgi:sec-independent protein translocase protein TatA